tara:strand:+ start:3332 stop:3901 length:570 start_codon:yes stop_codon:yes gene_type:complete
MSLATRKQRSIQVTNLKEVQRALRKFGVTPAKSRNKINKVLEPAAQIAVNSAKLEFKRGSENKPPGKRYNPFNKTTFIGPSLSDAIGMIPVRRGRNPGIFVGPRLKGIYKWANLSKDGAVNLAQLLVRGSKGERFQKSGKSTGKLPPQPDYLLRTARKKGGQISMRARKDLDKYLQKIIKESGFIPSKD